MKTRSYDRVIRWAGYIQIYGGFRMSCKSRGKESEIESVKSHRKPQARIEKEVGHLLRGTKKPAIYFQIAAFGTGSKKNLKVIYMRIMSNEGRCYLTALFASSFNAS